ncbi:MAG: hypothetical protein J0L75_07810 [Spirochaetes bacterium]|nr:hypothetical protein [Spirochaetota bacterium]
MEIWLNGQKADIRLEEEKNVAQVLAALESWAESQGHLMDDVRVDGRPVPDPGDPALAGLAVDAVGRVELRLCTPPEYAFLVLGEIDAYLARMKGRLEDPRDLAAGELDDLLAGIDWLRKTLAGAVKPLRLSAEQEPLLALLKEGEIAAFRLRADGKPEFRQRLDATLGSLETGARAILRRGYFHLVRQVCAGMGPQDVAANLLGEGLRLLAILKQILPASAAEIQKGRDAAAMPLVQQAVEALELFLALVERSETLLRIERKEASDLSALREPLSAKLTELEGAFQRRDFVLLGDLLEYELTEHLPAMETVVRDLAARFPA